MAATGKLGRQDGAVVELSREECFELLGESGVGRIAFDTPSGPVIHPVNYLVHDATIVIRTSPYSQLGAHPLGLVAFEVDELEAELRSGWSVLVVGRCTPIEDPDEAIDLRRGGKLEPWAAGQRNLFVRISPNAVTGRRIG